MKEQERLAEEQYKTYKEKTEDTLIENKLEYEERKAALESRHPVYMQLKNAKIQLQKANIEEKTALQKMDDLKKIFRLRKEIERKFFNNSIVSFVSAIKKYHDNKDIYLKLKNAEKEEEKLIGILEEKLKKQCKRSEFGFLYILKFFSNHFSYEEEGSLQNTISYASSIIHRFDGNF